MPYITQEQRKEIDNGRPPLNAGELNYCITKLILNYSNGVECYQNYNDILGALEGAKLELYRRRIAKYENSKIISNGDVTDDWGN